MDDAPERRYDRDEVSEILRRAAEEQRATDETTSSDPGLTLAELQHVAEEAGIASRHVERAAGAVAANAPQDTESWWGFRRIERVRMFPYRVGESAWRRVLAEARRDAGGQGELKNTTGSSREWEGPMGVYVVLDADAEGSTLRVTPGEQVVGALAHVFGELVLPLAALFGIGGALTGSLGIGLLAVLVALVVGFVAARWVTRHRADRIAEETDALLARLSRVIEEETPPVPKGETPEG